MGWQESRITLIPAGWRPVSEEAPGTQTINGTPLRIVHYEREQDGAAGGTPIDQVHQWLLGHGFTFKKWPDDSCLLWRDVEAEPYSQDGELAELILTFTLSRESPSRWAVWQALVTDLCEALDLGLADAEQGVRVGADELLRLLAQTVSWRECQERYHWPVAIAESK